VLDASSYVWRGDYFCCKKTPFHERKIPQKYITDAFKILGIADANLDERGFCIFLSGGKKAILEETQNLPVLVYGPKSLESGTPHQNILLLYSFSFATHTTVYFFSEFKHAHRCVLPIIVFHQV
jgi:hypothetical protein